VHKVNWMQSVDEYADMLGVNPKLVVPDDEAEAAYASEQKAMQQQQQAMAMKDGTAAASNLGKIPMDQDTALTRIVEGVTGA
jgi:hypothetical protein